MQDEADAAEDSAASLSNGVPWTVVAVTALPNYRIAVEFVDGTRGEVDLYDFVMAEDAGVFIPLRDPTFFAQVDVVLGAVTWPGELDLAPDAMYDTIRAAAR